MPQACLNQFEEDQGRVQAVAATAAPAGGVVCPAILLDEVVPDHEPGRVRVDLNQPLELPLGVLGVTVIVVVSAGLAVARVLDGVGGGGEVDVAHWFLLAWLVYHCSVGLHGSTRDVDRPEADTLGILLVAVPTALPLDPGA